MTTILLSANGGSLVCNENLTLNGTLNVNGGLVDAKKNLTVAPGGNIAMPNANDVVSVKGDFVVNTSANITLSNGLLDLKGDLVLNTAVWFATGANLHAQFSGTPGQQQIRYPAGGGASFGKLAVPGLDPRPLNIARGTQNFYIDCTNNYCTNPLCTFRNCGRHTFPELSCANCAMGNECSVNKIWASISGEIYDAAPTMGAAATYYIAYRSNGDMLTNNSSSLGYSRFVLASHATENPSRRWNFIGIGNGKYLVQSVSDTNLYLTANPANGAVSLAALKYWGADSNQYWQMSLSAEGNALMSASANANIAGHKLDGTSSLSNSAYTPVVFFDVDIFVPATAITVSDFDLIIGQPRQAPSPVFAPDNAFGGTSGVWLTHESPYGALFTVDENGLCTATGVVTTAVYTVRSKITSVEGSASVSIVRLPHPDVQNKTKWCWAAAAKKVGEHNGDSGKLPTGGADLIDTDGLHSVNWVDYFGMKPGPVYTADAGQRHIVVHALKANEEDPDDDSDVGGDDIAKMKGLDLASLNDRLVWSISGPTLALVGIDMMNSELAEDRWVIANLFTRTNDFPHSIVVKSVTHDIYDDIYTYWDPWKGEDGVFTATDIANETIRIVSENGIDRKIFSIQYCGLHYGQE